MGRRVARANVERRKRRGTLLSSEAVLPGGLLMTRSSMNDFLKIEKGQRCLVPMYEAGRW